MISLPEILEKEKVTDYQFFATAYLWAFNKAHAPWTDVYEYRKDGTIPIYVQKFIKHHYD